MNITQTNFLYWQNVHIWHLIKFNYKFIVRSSAHIKSTLMSIWELSYMFVFMQKQHPESFAFLFPRILKLFAREVCQFLDLLLFLNVCEQTFPISYVRISKKRKRRFKPVIFM